MTATLSSLALESDLAFVRAAYYRFLSRVFSYPRAGLAEILREELPTAALSQLWEGAAADEVQSAVEAVGRELRDATDEELETCHVQTFGHTISETFPPHETRYGSSHPFQETQDLADVSAFYGAFGLRVKPGAGERVDHAWLELEFVHFLAVKQLLALERGETEGAERTLEAARGFLKDHIGRWGPVFGEILAKKAPSSLHQAYGALLAAVLKADVKRLGVTPGQVSAEPIPIPPEPEASDEEETEEHESSGCGA
ncbi:MAG: anaerobic dehydrogenase-like [Planctomycetota bacterium]|nr:MAG: anaerobic dehydrogenase-like [Planctomycetota bacterium]